MSGDISVTDGTMYINTAGSITTWPYVAGSLTVWPVSGGSAPSKWQGWTADEILDHFAKELALKRPVNGS